MLQEELENEFPAAEVEISHGINDRHMVDGMEDHADAEWVGEVINCVWSPFNWVVEA
jgi:hypothetical protein